MTFIKDPSRLFLKMLTSIEVMKAKDKRFYDYGRLSVGLEIVTQIKQLESLPVVSDLGRQEAVSALHTLLVELQIDDLAYLWYEKLDEGRKPKFVEVETVVKASDYASGRLPFVSPPNTSASVSPPSVDPSDPASARGALEGAASPDDRPPASSWERRLSDPASLARPGYVGGVASEEGELHWPLGRPRPRKEG